MSASSVVMDADRARRRAGARGLEVVFERVRLAARCIDKRTSTNRQARASISRQDVAPVLPAASANICDYDEPGGNGTTETESHR